MLTFDQQIDWKVWIIISIPNFGQLKFIFHIKEMFRRLETYSLVYIPDPTEDSPFTLACSFGYTYAVCWFTHEK